MSPSDTPLHLPDFQTFNLPRLPHCASTSSHSHGGVLAYVRKSLGSDVRVWKQNPQHDYVWLCVPSCSQSPDLYIACLYMRPRYADAHAAFQSLQTEVAEIQAQHGGSIVIAGDFNARTGTLPDQLYISDVCPHLPSLPEAVSCPAPSRGNVDTTVSPQGRALVEFCKSSDLCIVNGRVDGDRIGQHTCHSYNGGHSTVDYFIVSSVLFPKVVHMHVLAHEPDALSVHSALHLKLRFAQSQPVKSLSSSEVHLVRYKYNPELNDGYLARITQQVSPLFEHANRCANVDTTLDILQQCIASTASSIYGVKSRSCSNTAPHNKWFDQELKTLRRDLRSAWALGPPHMARILQKRFRNLVKRKKQMYYKQRSASLSALAKECPAAFWKAYTIKQPVQHAIPPSTWSTYFAGLLGAPSSQLVTFDHPDSLVSSYDLPSLVGLNENIDGTEVLAALQKLRRNKAAGLDGIRAEYILDAGEVLLPFLTMLFNRIFREGFPASLGTGLIFPIYKAGDVSDPGNYRGITVGPVIAKLFAMILDARITDWTEDHNIRARGQAGFRRDFRTTDNIFVLRSLLEKYKGKRLYCCFVDFKKAFDTVPRHMLWAVLHNIGIRGDMLRCLQSMYGHDTACVFTPEGLSATFSCGMGVKQGCPLSPNLFGLFVDGIEKHILELDCDAPSLGDILVPLLLFADDLTLISESVRGLQLQLNALHVYCRDYGLTVNISKTKAVYFHMRESTVVDTVFYDGKPIERVQSFRYLGAHFHATKGFAFAAEQLLAAAKKALHALHRRCIALRITDPLLKTKLFDALVGPVLNYACEVWAVDLPLTMKPKQEQLHTDFLKSLLGVSYKANDANIRGEFGRYPIAIFWFKMIVKFYNRMCVLPNDRILHHAFKDMVQMYSTSTKVCWLSKFAAMLVHLFGENTEYLACLRDGLPIEEWKEAFTACRTKYVSQQRQHDSLIAATYWSLKAADRYKAEKYISQVENRHDRRALAMFRTGAHWLRIQQGRFTATPREMRTCMLCNSGAVEDEAHMLFHCSAYDSLRNSFSCLFSHTFTSDTQTVAGFLDKNKRNMNAVAKYLEQCRILNKAHTT